MKKFIILILFIIFNYTNVYASYVVMNSDTNQVIYSSNMNEKRLIASISKVMTAYVVINNVSLDKIIEVTDEKSLSHGSSIYLSLGEKISVRDLLYGMMLRSGNDAATLLANYTFDDYDRFIEEMNITAQKIGMNNTIFQNPTGLDDEGTQNYSTAYDMALLTSRALKNKTFKEIFGTKSYSTKSNLKSFKWTNKNKALFMYSNITGGKTGYTKKSKRTLITSASSNGENLVIVSLNISDDFNFHINKYKEIFKNYDNYLVINKTNFKISNTTYNKKYMKFYIKNNYFLYEKKNNLKNYRIEYLLYNTDRLYNNMVIGKLFLKNNDLVIYEEPIFLSYKRRKY